MPRTTAVLDDATEEATAGPPRSSVWGRRIHAEMAERRVTAYARVLTPVPAVRATSSVIDMNTACHVFGWRLPRRAVCVHPVA
ncbi:hypothetical protein GCM10010207_19900 [Streptomyces atratus]|uniref:hypothetical protein n=1 Tax=Streptomyces atratus TaxID=1893 RepID=UPI0016711BCF|nr:hypothetical protein [Streptomyces atratus]GGT20586.1 hypothetical protein GCM10010207_19900 [Streptomyces atratus]